jgi:nitroreductase
MSSDYKPMKLPDRPELTDDQMAKNAQTFLELMKQRHTVRDYSTRPVSQKIIEDCIAAAGTAPSGANQQPWHFVAIQNPAIKSQIRIAAEEEEQKFYDGGASDEWLAALEPIGTGVDKPHLELAPWLIVIFAQRYGVKPDGERYKHYYVPESVGIASGMLLTALHNAGLVTLTHTPNPMKFLSEVCDRPAAEKALMIVAVGHPDKDAQIPKAAKMKKALSEIMTVL